MASPSPSGLTLLLAVFFLAQSLVPLHFYATRGQSPLGAYDVRGAWRMFNPAAAGVSCRVLFAEQGDEEGEEEGDDVVVDVAALVEDVWLLAIKETCNEAVVRAVRRDVEQRRGKRVHALVQHAKGNDVTLVRIDAASSALVRPQTANSTST